MGNGIVLFDESYMWGMGLFYLMSPICGECECLICEEWDCFI